MMFWINLIFALYDLNLNQLDRNINSPPIAHFSLINVVFRNQKFKKEKWPCSQNLDLNLTCGVSHYAQKEVTDSFNYSHMK